MNFREKLLENQEEHKKLWLEEFEREKWRYCPKHWREKPCPICDGEKRLK